MEPTKVKSEEILYGEVLAEIPAGVIAKHALHQICQHIAQGPQAVVQGKNETLAGLLQVLLHYAKDTELKGEVDAMSARMSEMETQLRNLANMVAQRGQGKVVTAKL